MKRNEAIKFVLLRSLGNFLVLFSLYGVFAVFGPALYYEAQYQLIKVRSVQYEVPESVDIAQPGFGDLLEEENATDNPGFADILAGSKEQILIPKDTNFSITIPKIGASAKVYPNIDPLSAPEYLPVLQKGIAHAKGSVFPGLSGNVYLFAHSTDNWWNVGRYNAIFYLLKNLSAGDEVIVFFENRRHDYVISKSVIVDANDTSYISREQSGGEQLVLQTCWPPGTTWKRLVVVANPK